MTKPVIFIPYETKNREFDGRLLLISRLLKDFDTVLLGSRKGIKREVLRYHNGILILKSLAQEDEAFYQILKKRKFTIFLLHAEGGVFTRNSEEIIKSLFPAELIKHIAKVFLLGDEVKNNLMRQLPEMLHDRLLVTGDPRFDLLKEEYHAFFASAIDKIKSRYGDFVLINTSFSVANPYVGVEKFFKYHNQVATHTAEFSKKLFRKHELIKMVLEIWIQAIKQLADIFPEKSFVIRPHPSESLKIYSDSFKKYPNIFISKVGNVVPWILASQAVVHYDCTTGMEAMLAGKPVISFIPEKDDDLIAWLPVQLSKQVADVDSLSAALNDVFNHSFTNPLAEEMIAIWKKNIANVEKFSSQLISDEINKTVAIGQKKSCPRHFVLQVLLARIKSSLKLVKDAYLLKTRSITRDKFGKLDRKEVIEKMALFNAIHEENIRYRVSFKGNDVIEITRR